VRRSFLVAAIFDRKVGASPTVALSALITTHTQTNKQYNKLNKMRLDTQRGKLSHKKTKTLTIKRTVTSSNRERERERERD
jgi:hypothetical protein